MMAEETARRTSAAARGTGEDGEEQFLALARGNMEGLIRANQALIDSTSELSRSWLVCWQEQLAEGMELARVVLERQDVFVRSSLERLNAQATRSAELTSGMADRYFVPLREHASRATEQTTQPAA
jgi:Phasin protein